MVFKFLTSGLLLTIFFNFTISAQDTDLKVERLNKVYKNLEYNTIGFNDLKSTWIVTDPVLVRAIFNRFLVKNVLRVNGRKPSIEVIKEKAKDIYSGEVFIDLRKRYYDNEIEYFRFYTEKNISQGDTTDFFFDPVVDYVLLKEIMGDEYYDLLKEKAYAFNDITKSYYDNKLAYKFDIYLSLLEPHVTFWNFTTNNKNKYLLSAFGKWGIDNIAIPGWYNPSYTAGLKVTYIDRILNNKPNDVYFFEVGFGLPTGTTFKDKNLALGKRLHRSAFNIYLNAYGNFLRYASESLSPYDINIEASVSLSDLETANIKDVTPPVNVFSSKNYLSLSMVRKNFFELSSFGHFGASLGLGIFDVHNLFLDPTILEPVDQSVDKTKFFTKASIMITQDNPLLSYSFEPSFMFNVSESNSYFGIKFSFMLSNAIGFDFRYYGSINFSDNVLPAYREDSYVVFSPIIRINY